MMNSMFGIILRDNEHPDYRPPKVQFGSDEVDSSGFDSSDDSDGSDESDEDMVN